MSSPANPGGEPGPGVRRRAEDLAPRRSDKSPWNWLLLLPIALPLLVPLYNRAEPELFGWPFFYWVQLTFVLVGVLTTSLVFRAHQRGKKG